MNPRIRMAIAAPSPEAPNRNPVAQSHKTEPKPLNLPGPPETLESEE